MKHSTKDRATGKLHEVKGKVIDTKEGGRVLCECE